MTPQRFMPSVALAAALLLTWQLGGCAPKRVLRQPAATDAPRSASVPMRPPTPPPGVTAPTAPGSAATPPAAAPAAGAPTAVERSLSVAEAAQAQLGRPYRWGGNQPHVGFDCSGLTQWSYRRVGVELPRRVAEQQHTGVSISPDRLRPGDLVFFKLQGSRPSHVGIYIGGGEFVHAPRAGQPVRTDSLDDPWWRRRWSEARRILDR